MKQNVQSALFMFGVRVLPAFLGAFGALVAVQYPTHYNAFCGAAQ